MLTLRQNFVLRAHSLRCIRYLFTSVLRRFICNLIQRTPHVDDLIEELALSGFSYGLYQDRIVTQYLKSRRLYDSLFQECFTYTDAELVCLKQAFHDTGNGYASELLFSTEFLPSEVEPYRFWRTIVRSINEQDSNMKDSEKVAIQNKAFAAAKLENAATLEAILKVFAQKSVLKYHPGTGLPKDKEGLGQFIDLHLENFRTTLMNLILSKRDWSSKTLLHMSVYAKQTDCLVLILKYAQEAKIKGILLDCTDAFGNTALHLALQNKNFQVSKRLISEGADIFLKNNQNQFPLQLIYQQRIPKLGMYLMNKAITVSGDVSSESPCLNIDFSVISAFIDFYAINGNSSAVYEPPNQSASQDLDSLEVQGEAIVFVPQSSQSHPSDHTQREEMGILAYLEYNDRKSCSLILRHPVARLFLQMKWNRMKSEVYGRSILGILIYLLYLFLTFQIYFRECPHQYFNSIKLGHGVSQTKSQECIWSNMTLALVPVTILTNIYFQLASILKMFLLLQTSRLGTWPVVFNILTWIRVFFFVIAVLTTTAPYYKETFQSHEYILATTGIMLGSILLLQLIGDSDWGFCIHSIYVHVYVRVLTRFLTVISTFAVILLGFAISFTVIFPQPTEFSTFLKSVFRLFIMIHGEFDFEDETLKIQREDKWMFWSGQLLFVLFGSIVTLVLIDVFLGYTVSDIKELREQAEDVKRRIQIEKLFLIEKFRILWHIMYRRFGYERNQDKLDSIFLIKEENRRKHRNSFMVTFEEIPEEMQTEFRDFLPVNST